MACQYWFVGPGSVAPPRLELLATDPVSQGCGVFGRSVRGSPARKRAGSVQTTRVGRRFSAVLSSSQRFRSTTHDSEAPVMDEVESLMTRVVGLRSRGAAARQQGDEAGAEQCFRRAFDLAIDAAKNAPTRVDVLCAATRLALDRGEVAEARRLMAEALGLDPSTAYAEEWTELRAMDAWPDAWLIAAVCRDPPDTQALDTLAERHWRVLFGRCQLLTLNHHKANDLGQEAWSRVLRARHSLKPGGNLPAYLATVVTNLWRDRNRSARRAGPLAEERLLALDAALPNEDGETVFLGEVLPDLNALRTQEQAILALDIDQALERLTPQLRDVLVARYLTGESCAEIGRRYGRTEQTISSWVRAAVREMRLYFEAHDRTAEAKETP